MPEITFEQGERVAIDVFRAGCTELFIGTVQRITKKYYAVWTGPDKRFERRISREHLRGVPMSAWGSTTMSKLTPEFEEKVRVQNLRVRCKSMLSDIVIPEDATEVGWLYAELIIIKDRQAARKSG